MAQDKRACLLSRRRWSHHSSGAPPARRRGDPVMDRRAFVNRIISSSLLLQPLLSIAQQSQKLFRVGFLSPGARLARSDDFQFDALGQGLRELGYIEGKNVVFERRWASGSSERLAELASGLVRLPVDVIVAQGPGGL